ncbi:MAG: PspC domain-containing protein [Clostridia bacterium]|nr:PspC domain-containing protein [Clostridia bacterium]MBR6941195.1 PspC domain-containing protein [Clostridia bacterium]
MNKKLCKSSTDRKLFGVCGGIAEYLGVDSTIVRLVLALFTLAGGSGVLIYIIAALVMPDDNNVA